MVGFWRRKFFQHGLSLLQYSKVMEFFRLLTTMALNRFFSSSVGLLQFQVVMLSGRRDYFENMSFVVVYCQSMGWGPKEDFEFLKRL